MQIITENQDYLLVVKPPELVSEQTPEGDGFGDLLSRRNRGYIGVIHRLDRGVGGLMVYAKTPSAAAWLSQAAQEHRLGKEYLAIAQGVPDTSCDELRDLLYYDRKNNKMYAVSRPRRGVKEAILTYRVLRIIPHPETGAPLALVSVRPVTGRTHQIRVQFASRRLPLLGDRRYGGSGNTGIALWCRSIILPAHGSLPEQTCTYNPAGAPWDWFEPARLSGEHSAEEP